MPQNTEPLLGTEQKSVVGHAELAKKQVSGKRKAWGQGGRDIHGEAEQLWT